LTRGNTTDDKSNTRDIFMNVNILVKLETYLHNTMDKTDIAHGLNQYVEKLNIVLKTLRKHTTENR
jgi:hypothetical protein